jgi:uncharacterized membrane protein
MEVAKPLLGIVVALAIGDATWLTLRNEYHRDLFARIQKSQLEVRWIPALLVYAVIVAAVYFGAVQNASSAADATVRGLAIGFLLYAFYDFTNYATLTKYTLEMTIIDITWGTVLCAAAASAGYFLKQLK